MTALTHLATVACAGTLLLAATGCGSSDQPTQEQAQQPADQAPAAGSAPNAGPGGMRNFPGASGEIAAVDGSTAQVQSQQTGQVAVTWNGQTTFTKQVTAKLADVEVGACVMVRSDDATAPDASTVAATTVRITEPVDGACSGGFGGREARVAPPSGMPSPREGRERPEGARPDRAGMGGGAFGEVAAVSDNGLTVTSQRPGGDEASTITVTVSANTTYSRQAAGSAADVKVGSCATARGEADDTGAITAETIAISPKEDGSCGGFMMRGGPRPGAADQAQES